MSGDVLHDEVISRVLINDDVADEAETYSASLEAGGTRFYTGVAKVIPDEDIFVVFTLPSKSNTVFVTATDGNLKVVRRVLSNLEEMELGGTCLHIGDVVRFEDVALAQFGVVAAVLLPLGRSAIFAGMDDSFVHNDVRYSIVLVGFSRRKSTIFGSSVGTASSSLTSTRSTRIS